MLRGLVLLVENLLFPLGALAVVLRFLLSPRRRVLLSLGEELRERFGGVSADKLDKLRGRRVLWVHAASAGEVAAVSGLLARIKAAPNPPAVILTTTTMTGRDKAAALPHADAASLAPLDCYPAVARFLDAVKPSALLLVETELWPQMLALAKSRGVRVGLVNARMTERSFGRYIILAPLARPFLRMIDRICAQSEADSQRFQAVGAASSALLVAGNMKYDRLEAPKKDEEAGRRLRALGWEGSPVWVAGSTHPVEEDAVLAAYKSAREKIRGLKLVLAPRHPERAAQAAQTLREAGVSFRAWSDAPSRADCLLLDKMGLLTKFYAFACVSFVGGTLVPVGGHNLLEPAIAGSPVIFGPRTEHTAEVARLLSGAGCGICVDDAEELSSALCDLLGNEPRRRALGLQARALAEGLRGAIERSLKHLQPVLAP
ncbi:MAG: 3-deoxy-D-manno-octulosonic acid transferase [Elusimicrobia bacterium]|nr:3-deoxy-D-manno-octulosonic acid transferase [Elusimicrobiota bacterium]